ncbi:MAG TPA: hypothetical protein VIU37_09100, partial [Candidatus Limnocylindrales bacterium]
SNWLLGPFRLAESSSPEARPTCPTCGVRRSRHTGFGGDPISDEAWAAEVADCRAQFDATERGKRIQLAMAKGPYSQEGRRELEELTGVDLSNVEPVSRAEAIGWLEKDHTEAGEGLAASLTAGGTASPVGNADQPARGGTASGAAPSREYTDEELDAIVKAVKEEPTWRCARCGKGEETDELPFAWEHLYAPGGDWTLCPDCVVGYIDWIAEPSRALEQLRNRTLMLLESVNEQIHEARRRAREGAPGELLNQLVPEPDSPPSIWRRIIQRITGGS